MNLFSLFRSSAAEIILSKRFMAFAYGLFGLAITAQIVASVAQFTSAYTHSQRFDVTTTSFIVITLLFFMPFWITGALILRACLQRLRLALWVKRAFTFAEYTTPILPAEAGFLVDYEYNHKELVATLLDLHYKGVLRISMQGSEVVIGRSSGAYAISNYEQALIENIALTGQAQTYISFDDPRLVGAAKNAQQIIIDQLTNRGLLCPERQPRLGMKVAFRFIYVIAGIVGACFCYALLFQYSEVMSVKPLYGMTVSEVWVLGMLCALTLGVVVSGLWPRFSTDPKSPVYAAWTDAAGFMLYLRTVYKDRLAPDAIVGQSQQAIHAYAPYAVAFGVLAADSTTIAPLLNL